MFIKATFKFIKIIVIILVKELLGMLGPFYSNNKSTKKEEKSKQLTKLQYFFKLRDAVLTLIFIILKTDNPQQIKDKSYKVHSPIPKNASWLPSNRLLLVQDKVYIIAQPIPTLGTLGTPYFIKQNILQFIK